MSDFGKRLKKLRIEHGDNQQDIADKFHKTKATISNYETSTYEPNLEFIIEIAKYYNVSIDYLLGLTDERKPTKVDPEFTNIISQAKQKGLTPKELKTVIKIYPQIRQIIESIEGEE